ncbi:MAG: hypothetical protein AB7K24_04100 [Gemmataceae bacterium]
MNETVLQKLYDWRPEGRQSLHLPDLSNGWSVTLTADRNDELGCLVWELTARRAAAKVELKACAAKLAARLSFEPFKVHEVDAERNEAQLRSAKPAERDLHVVYYELALQGTGNATLRRYQATHDGGKPRSQVTYPLTHESLVKLIEEVIGE